MKKSEYNKIANFYDFLDYYWEKRRYQPARKKLWKHAKGKRILDAGVGTGRNIPFYPKAEMHAIDISKAMLEQARKRAKNVKIQKMDLTKLKYKGNYFDTVVATFVLCVMNPRQEEKAIKEVKRVLKKGGRLCMLDYTLSKKPLRRAFQKLTKPLVYALYGLILDNPTLELLQKHLKIKKVEYLKSDTLRLIIAEK